MPSGRLCVNRTDCMCCCYIQAKATTGTHLGEDYDRLMAPVLSSQGAAVSCEDMRNCFFGAYMDSSKLPEERQYSQVLDVPALIGTMEGYLIDHNGTISWCLLACRRQCNAPDCAMPTLHFVSLGGFAACCPGPLFAYRAVLAAQSQGCLCKSPLAGMICRCPNTQLQAVGQCKRLWSQLQSWAV